jgi:hypothetical protein
MGRPKFDRPHGPGIPAKALFEHIHRTSNFVRLYDALGGKHASVHPYWVIRKNSLLEIPSACYASAIQYDPKRDKEGAIILFQKNTSSGVEQRPSNNPARLSSIVMAAECRNITEAQAIISWRTPSPLGFNLFPNFDYAVFQEGHVFLIWRLQRTARKNFSGKRFFVTPSLRRIYEHCILALAHLLPDFKQ